MYQTRLLSKNQAASIQSFQKITKNTIPLISLDDSTEPRPSQKNTSKTVTYIAPDKSIELRLSQKKITKTVTHISPDKSIEPRTSQKKITKKTVPLISLDDSIENNRMNIENDWEQLELQLNPDRDYIPSCFLSQESNKVSSQVSQGTLEELLAPISNSSHDNWQLISNDPMYESSVTFSPTSLPQSPAEIETSKTTAEELIDHFLPSSQNSVVSLDDLEDLVQIIAEKEGAYPPEPTPEDSLPGCILFYEDPSDSLAYALSPEVQTGFVIQRDPNNSSQEATPEPQAFGNIENKIPAKRGRKRKNSESSGSGDDCFEKKKKQNAEAAKRYRQKKRDEDDMIFEEREKMAAELQKTKKLFQNKMNERNILLKMLYEAYTAKDSTVREKFGNIKWPEWLPQWYEKQQEREDL